MEEVTTYTKEIAKGSFWSLIGNVSTNFISFFYVILIARAVSQDDLGLFYLSLSVVTFMSVFTNLGVSNSLARYVPYFEGKNEPGKIKILLKSGYVIVTILAVLIMILLWMVEGHAG
jgi:O-antigen/teichoic acid export membrane protein